MIGDDQIGLKTLDTSKYYIEMRLKAPGVRLNSQLYVIIGNYRIGNGKGPHTLKGSESG